MYSLFTMTIDSHTDVPICFLLRKMSKILGEFHTSGMSKELSGFNKTPIDEIFLDFSRLQDLVDHMTDSISETSSINIDLKEYGVKSEDVELLKDEVEVEIQEDRMY